MRFRPATMADGEALLAWRNDPATRAAAINTGEVGRNEHFAWLARALADPGRRLLMAEEEDGAVFGMLRFDRRDGAWEVSINLAPSARGRGMGGRVLAKGIACFLAETGPVLLLATVREENQASRRIFERCGFRLTGSGAGLLSFRREA